ncbi:MULTISPECIES: amidohydrolase [unclassified Luteococcus]|uniref:amidohydrolase n=1 Tax=unclassified Luteococcus TaxID=2639923 RepID=UPI00313CB038
MSSTDPALQGIEQTLVWQEELYKQLHANPELSMQESETAAEITRRLEGFGYQTQQVGGGVVGVLENGEGRCVLTRADIDALPVTEATGLDYASQIDGAMHACGHDMHITWSLGAAELLAQHRDAWSGTHVALFQPGEEIAAGARSMVDDGLVDKLPKPDVCLSQHVLPGLAGTVSTSPGPILSAGDSIRITLHGKGSHGSMPHLGVDPVVLASTIVVRLQGIVSRVIAPGDFGVVTVGSIQAGSKSNIIPDSATLLLNVRTYDNAVRDKVLEAIERIVRGECEASGCPKEPDFEYYDRFPLTTNDEQTTQQVTDAFVESFGQERVLHLAPIPASEDFSVIPDAFGVPYCYWGVGGFAEDAEVVGNHNPGFAPTIHPTLQTGTEALAVATLAWLGKNTPESENKA